MFLIFDILIVLLHALFLFIYKKKDTLDPCLFL